MPKAMMGFQTERGCRGAVRDPGDRAPAVAFAVARGCDAFVRVFRGETEVARPSGPERARADEETGLFLRAGGVPRLPRMAPRCDGVVDPMVWIVL